MITNAFDYPQPALLIDLVAHTKQINFKGTVLISGQKSPNDVL